MDSISSFGTKFYIAAGNNGSNYLNLYSLVDNSITVSACNPFYEEKMSYSGDNSVVRRREDGQIRIQKTKDGFNLTDGEETDVFYNQTSMYLFKNPVKELRGSSIASPRAIIRDYNPIFKR